MEFFPNEIENIIKDYVIFKPKNKDELEDAVYLWCEDKEEALNIYSHISIWDTSLITDMSELFKEYECFNDNINYWDVSNVTNMSDMFYKASSFNQPLNLWNVSNVTNVKNMFYKNNQKVK